MKHILLIGGGHCNIQVLKILHDHYVHSSPKAVELTLVSDGEVAYYSGMLTGVISGQYQAEDIQISLRALAYSCGANFLPLPVTEIRPREQSAVLGNGKELTYGIAVVDIGSQCKDASSVPGVQRHCIPTRPLQRFQGAIEEAELRFRGCNETPVLTIVGGGAAGVELAFALYARWRSFFVSEVPITIVTSGTHILPGASESLRSITMSSLHSKGISIEYQKEVAEVQEHTVVFETGEHLNTDIVIWATGAEPQLLNTNLELCENGFIKVNDYLQSVQYDSLFAGGDCITMVNQPTGFPPKAGVYAVREGPVIASNIISLLENRELQRYIPQEDYLCLMNTGDGRGIGGKYGIAFSGVWVWNMKNHIDRSFMRKFSLESLLGQRGMQVFLELKGSEAALSSVYSASNPEKADYSQQFGLEKDPSLASLECEVSRMTPQEAVSRLGGTQSEFEVNLLIIKRLGAEEAFRKSCVEVYTEWVEALRL